MRDTHTVSRLDRIVLVAVVREEISALAQGVLSTQGIGRTQNSLDACRTHGVHLSAVLRFNCRFDGRDSVCINRRIRRCATHVWSS